MYSKYEIKEDGNVKHEFRLEPEMKMKESKTRRKNIRGATSDVYLST